MSLTASALSGGQCHCPVYSWLAIHFGPGEVSPSLKFWAPMFRAIGTVRVQRWRRGFCSCARAQWVSHSSYKSPRLPARPHLFSLHALYDAFSQPTLPRLEGKGIRADGWRRTGDMLTFIEAKRSAGAARALVNSNFQKSAERCKF